MTSFETNVNSAFEDIDAELAEVYQEIDKLKSDVSDLKKLITALKRILQTESKTPAVNSDDDPEHHDTNHDPNCNEYGCCVW